MNYSPCFLITYFTQCVCVWYGINLYRKGGVERGKKAVQGLEIHQVPGMSVVRGSWGLLASGWLAAVKGFPPSSLLLPLSSPQRKSFGGRVSDANTEGINIILLLCFLSHPLHSHQSRKFSRNGFTTWVPSAKRDH